MRIRSAVAASTLVLTACAGASRSQSEMSGVERAITSAVAQQLVGTWELVSTRITRGDSVLLDARSPSIRAYKILNATHFSVLTMRDGQFLHAGAGPYTLNGDAYTEIVELASGSFTPGTAFNFRINVDGDLWSTDGGSGAERFVEVWRRVR